MSTAGQTTQLQQDILHELITANQLLQLISSELQLIKQFTHPGKDFENNIKENADLLNKLANLQQIDITNIPTITRTNELQNQLHNISENRNDSEMD